MRHSQPQKNRNLPNEDIPLSQSGVRLARELFATPVFSNIVYAYSSPYRRALDTAAILGLPVKTDTRLIERQLGDKTTLNELFWAKQYTDPDYKNRDGESLREVGARMNSFMECLLSRMTDGETSVVVSHAAAICAYLMGFCTITVLDAAQKTRKITFRDHIVLSGQIKTPSAFILEFSGNRYIKISYTE